jgi:hypothetical protein
MLENASTISFLSRRKNVRNNVDEDDQHLNEDKIKCFKFGAKLIEDSFSFLI